MFAQHEFYESERVWVWSGVDVVSFVGFHNEVVREGEREREKKHVKRTNLIFKFNTQHTHTYIANSHGNTASKWISFRSGRCGILLRWFLCKVKTDLTFWFPFGFAKSSEWCDEFKWKPKCKDGHHRYWRRRCRHERTKEKEILTNKTIKKWHPILCVYCVIYFNEYNFQNISKISSWREKQIKNALYWTVCYVRLYSVLYCKCVCVACKIWGECDSLRVCKRDREGRTFYTTRFVWMGKTNGNNKANNSNKSVYYCITLFLSLPLVYKTGQKTF